MRTGRNVIGMRRLSSPCVTILKELLSRSDKDDRCEKRRGNDRKRKKKKATKARDGASDVSPFCSERRLAPKGSESLHCKLACITLRY